MLGKNTPLTVQELPGLSQFSMNAFAWLPEERANLSFAGHIDHGDAVFHMKTLRQSSKIWGQSER